MNSNELKSRTKKFALRIIKLVESLPENKLTKVIGSQILRSGTSVGANYRSASRAKSTADFINKLKIVEEEADETLYWLEILIEANIIEASRLSELLKENNELIAIFVSTIKSTKNHKSN